VGFLFTKNKDEVCLERAIEASNRKFDKRDEDIRAAIEYLNQEGLCIWEDGRTTAHLNRDLVRLIAKRRAYVKGMFKYFMNNYKVGQDSFKEEDRPRVRDLKSASDLLLGALKELEELGNG
jgi:hypothetical protein